MKKDVTKNNLDLRIDKPRLIKAIDACIEHASDHYGISVKDIASAIEVNMWTLYKWIENGKMPLTEIAKFEDICHARYITRYLSEASGFILMSCPRGMDTPENALVTLNKTSSSAVAAVADFIESKKTKAQTIKTIDTAIESLVWQKKRIEDEA